MKHIGTGMQPGTMIEAVLFLLGMLGLFILYKLYYHRIERRWFKRRGAFADRKFDETAGLLGILPSDRELLLELAGYLPEPDLQKHLLFSDPVLFDVSRRDYLADHPGQVERLLSLRVRLDHPSKGSGRALHSTTELPPGTLLFAASEGANGGAGAEEETPPLFRVREILPETMLVDFLQSRPRANSRITLEIQRPDGHYRFATSVLETGEENARLQHAYHLERRQNRRYVRKDVSLEGALDRHRVRIVNLGGGGARLHATRAVLGDLSADDTVKIRVHLPAPAERKIEATARVIEVKPEHHLLRCEFIRIRESDRDRIVKFILTPDESVTESNAEQENTTNPSGPEKEIPNAS